MFFNAKQVLEAGNAGKWVKVTPEEATAIVDSIPGENLVRNSGAPGTGGTNLRHYLRDGYICVTVDNADVHPSDLA